ncbi:MAG: BREX system P-loop protein BrxC [Cyanobacteria bacterium J06560_6]
MQIEQIFDRPIKRNINGVIKVGQQDPDSVYQELHEYVVTKELDRHFQAFFERYTEALSSPTDKMGVWISGFFGSGKSHFLKILSYLLANREAQSPSDESSVERKAALDFFDERKVADAMLRAAMQKAAQASTDVILFNIDSKADANSKREKDSIVKVFQKVFDECRGYFGAVPVIADFERKLDKKGQYDDFKRAFEAASGEDWETGRDGWLFNQEAIATALHTATGMTLESANRLVEDYDKTYDLSTEKFACGVRNYLEEKGRGHQLIFMVDEVGQYIGENPDLMLNLQTVVEDLGVYCQGRAWVVVTSQEAIDEITNNKIKGNDFSKIVGRFGRPLSLSSANTDEVIKLRLLYKEEQAAVPELEMLFDQKQAILKNQIAFTADSAELPGYRNGTDFVAAYPFVSYQFGLLQKVFTQVRVMGSAGKHLASGERSLLDAFQIAAKAVADQPVGALVPFHTFYLAIEGFLDSVISQVVTQAAENPQLQAFDVNLLKTLFMVKYVKEIGANLDNLTTLSLSHIDEDKLKLRERVEGALTRLEKQTLIQRSGDTYSFLTHEEQDIGREIKLTDVDPSEVTGELQKMVWDTIFTEKKLKYDARHQYGFNRKLDDQAYGQQSNDFALHLMTPYAERYQALQEDAACLLATGDNQEVLVRLPDDSRLLDEVNELVRTDKYVRRKNSGSLSASIRRILDSRAQENSNRRSRIEQTLRGLITEAAVFVAGNKVQIGNRDTRVVLTEGLTYLVENVYTKLSYVESGFNTDDEVTTAFTRDSVVVLTNGESPNSAAHKEMQTWLGSERRSHRRVTIRNLTKQFTTRPYGWSELDTLGVMAELVNLGKVELRKSQATVSPQERGLVASLRSRNGLDSYLVQLCDEVDPGDLRVATDLANEILPEAPPADAVKLFEAYQAEFQKTCVELQQWKTAAVQGQLPFVELLGECLELVQNLLAQDGAAAFCRVVREQREALEDYVDDLSKLTSFFGGQLQVFKQAKRDLHLLEPELRHLSDDGLLSKVAEVKRILALSDPTREIPRLRTLLQPVQVATNTVRQGYVVAVQSAGQVLKEKLESYGRDNHSGVIADLNLSRFTQRIDEKTAGLDRVATIDSAIARQSELDRLEAELYRQIDAESARILAERQPEDDDNDDVPLVVQKPIVAVKVAMIAQKSVLETEQDVNDYVDVLRDSLVQEINQNKRVRLE